MLPEEQDALLSNYVLLVQNVRVHNIQMYLIQYGVLTLADAESIKSRPTATDKIESLLTYLTHSDRPNVFDRLLEALEEGDCGFVADKIKTTITNMRRRKRPLLRAANLAPEEHQEDNQSRDSTSATFEQRLRSMRLPQITSHTDEKVFVSGTARCDQVFFPSGQSPFPDNSMMGPANVPTRKNHYEHPPAGPLNSADARERLLWNTSPPSMGPPTNQTAVTVSMNLPSCSCQRATYSYHMHPITHPQPHDQAPSQPSFPSMPYFNYPSHPSKFHPPLPHTGQGFQHTPCPNSTSLYPPTHSPIRSPTHSPQPGSSPRSSSHVSGCGFACECSHQMSRLRLGDDEKRDLGKDNGHEDGTDDTDGAERRDLPTPLLVDRQSYGTKAERTVFPIARRSVDAGRVGAAGARQALVHSAVGSARAQDVIAHNADSLKSDEKLVFIERERDQSFGFSLRLLESKYFLVDEVELDGVAYLCGALCQDDVITSINGIDATSLEMDQAVSLIRGTSVQLILKVQHAGTTHVVPKSIKLNVSKTAPCGFKLLGGAERPRFPGDQCFYVTKVYPDTIAWRQRIMVGDVIVSVNNEPISDITYDQVLGLMKCAVEREEGMDLFIHRFEYTSPTL